MEADTGWKKMETHTSTFKQCFMFLPLSLNICSLILGTELLLGITIFLLTNKLDHLSSVVPTSHDNIFLRKAFILCFPDKQM